MSLAPILIIALPVLTVLAVGLVGSTRRLGFWLTVVLSIVLTPIGGFLAAFISGPRQRKKQPPKPAEPPPGE
jgi:hypothetical protein